MTLFEEKLQRLKKNLNIHRDKEYTEKELAELLGLNQKSFSARKRRGTFPEDLLLTLTMNKPDLKIDLKYVITGKPSDQMSRAEAIRLGIYEPDQHISELVRQYGDDGDRSRDNEPVTLESASSYRLGDDEFDLLTRFQQASLGIKSQVMKTLLAIDLASKTPDDYKPASSIPTNTTDNIYPLNKNEWEFIQRFRCADFALQSEVIDALLNTQSQAKPVEEPAQVESMCGFSPETMESLKQTFKQGGQHFQGNVSGGQFAARDIKNKIIKKKD